MSCKVLSSFSYRGIYNFDLFLPFVVCANIYEYWIQFFYKVTSLYMNNLWINIYIEHRHFFKCGFFLSWFSLIKISSLLTALELPLKMCSMVDCLQNKDLQWFPCSRGTFHLYHFRMYLSLYPEYWNDTVRVTKSAMQSIGFAVSSSPSTNSSYSAYHLMGCDRSQCIHVTIHYPSW